MNDYLVSHQPSCTFTFSLISRFVSFAPSVIGSIRFPLFQEQFTIFAKCRWQPTQIMKRERSGGKSGTTGLEDTDSSITLSAIFATVLHSGSKFAMTKLPLVVYCYSLHTLARIFPRRRRSPPMNVRLTWILVCELAGCPCSTHNPNPGCYLFRISNRQLFTFNQGERRPEGEQKGLDRGSKNILFSSSSPIRFHWFSSNQHILRVFGKADWKEI